MCHVTKYSTIVGVFQQPWPGVSPSTILIEEKALGTWLGIYNELQRRWAAVTSTKKVSLSVTIVDFTHN